MEKECLIQTKNLTKIYGKDNGATIALRDVSIDVYKGEFLAIVGRSACGKSTLLNLISGMDRPTSGEILFKGEDITKFSDWKLTNYRRDNIAFVFQFFNLLYDLTAVSNTIVSPGANKNINDIKQLFRDMGLENRGFDYPRNLSGGQQQRVAIARALNKKSDILICDEPTGALDEESGRDVLSIIEKVNKEEKKTVVLVTHTNEIANMADRVIHINNGEVVETIINKNKISASEVNF